MFHHDSSCDLPRSLLRNFLESLKVSRFIEAERNALINTISEKMPLASKHQQNFIAVVTQVYQAWQTYIATNPDTTELQETAAEFSAMCRNLIDTNKAGVATAYSIVAGGTVDGEGATLTLQGLLDEIAAAAQ